MTEKLNGRNYILAATQHLGEATSLLSCASVASTDERTIARTLARINLVLQDELLSLTELLPRPPTHADSPHD